MSQAGFDWIQHDNDARLIGMGTHSKIKRSPTFLDRVSIAARRSLHRACLGSSWIGQWRWHMGSRARLEVAA